MLAEMRQQGAEFKGAGAWSGHLWREIMERKRFWTAERLPKKLFTYHRVSWFLA